MGEAKARPSTLAMMINAAIGAACAAFFIYLHSGPEALARLGWGSIPFGVAVMLASSALGGWIGVLILKLIHRHRENKIRF